MEARLPGGHLQYRRADKLPGSVMQSGAVICEEPEDEDAQPARRQPAEAENGCQAFLHVRNRSVSNKHLQVPHEGTLRGLCIITFLFSQPGMCRCVVY